ncbi:hypothetical protein DTL21_23360 [Bremerella cremea]|uniref:Uncharacterized protein n=1 Tax=Blastopirellula marina TaxID=124 RepID=A0A2S8FDP8_9BACT|nr:MULTISPECIES: hypothetical protein [Pirellulaceae]PQO30301.1 hypothetical protein C5Y83_23325 [Blastopirellula marina]RCS43652.1 hypothetical protein DTL21_23360 [Bremerella cremea]
MEFPTNLITLLNEAEWRDALRWWKSLSAEQQHECITLCETLSESWEPLEEMDDTDSMDTGQPLYDYMVNHEYRYVLYVDEATLTSSYRFVSEYLAPLGADYRHGKPGMVW